MPSPVASNGLCADDDDDDDDGLRFPWDPCVYRLDIRALTAGPINYVFGFTFAPECGGSRVLRQDLHISLSIMLGLAVFFMLSILQFLSAGPLIQTEPLNACLAHCCTGCVYLESSRVEAGHANLFCRTRGEHI